jgi:predicted CoA-binding protein
MPELDDAYELERLYVETRSIAVLGAHPNPKKPAHFVPAYLESQGYRLIPVNPKYPSEELWGETPREVLRDIEEPVDVVDVFRRSEHLPDHLEDILQMEPIPKVVWLQQGIRNDEVAEKLRDAGIDVVQDACMLVVHKKLGLESKVSL